MDFYYNLKHNIFKRLEDDPPPPHFCQWSVCCKLTKAPTPMWRHAISIYLYTAIYNSAVAPIEQYLCN